MSYKDQCKKDSYQVGELESNNEDGQLIGSDTKYNEICDVCHGSGSLADNTCSSCNGKGTI